MERRSVSAEYCFALIGISGDFLLKIADGDVERATGEQIRGGIVVARLGKLPVGGSAGEIRKAQTQ